jgi:glucosamine-6-phosphate deaminase
VDVFIRNNYEEMSALAARIIAALVRRKPNAVLGLATGSTPIGTYRELVRMHREEGLDLSGVTTFNLDEYLGVARDLSRPYAENQSYARFMWEELFRDAEIPLEQTHVPDGLTEDPEAFCAWYEDAIQRAGGIDLQLLGIGRDGHWAFNEPGSSLASRTRVVALTEQTLEDNWESFYFKAGCRREDMPHFAITMGIGTILEARHVLMLASGSKKADIVAQALEGPVTAQVTASAMQLHPGPATVILDEAAAAKLARADHYRHVERLKAQYHMHTVRW